MGAENCRTCLRQEKALKFAASQVPRPTRRDRPRPASRTRARTCLPRCSSRLTTRLPTPPVAPAGQTVEVEHVCYPRGCCAAGHMASTQAATCWTCAQHHLTIVGKAPADSVRHAPTAATACAYHSCRCPEVLDCTLEPLGICICTTLQQCLSPTNSAGGHAQQASLCHQHHLRPLAAARLATAIISAAVRTSNALDPFMLAVVGAS